MANQPSYRLMKHLPGMLPGTVWVVLAREKRPNGLVTIMNIPHEDEHEIPARYLEDEEWFEKICDSDTDLFMNYFYKWLEDHGGTQIDATVDEHPGIPLWSLDLNKLKPAIMNLDFKEFNC